LIQQSLQAPKISVVVPAHNSFKDLELCLAALNHSTHPYHECIVVDDASTDDTAKAAEAAGCFVIRQKTNAGPAAARNAGAAKATGDILFFIDSDVCVAPDTLRRVADHFAADAKLDALIGSYDDRPQQADFLSQYKNLFHHFVHQQGSDVASTFWSGCGAIRRDVFLRYSGFSEDYKRPAIEDIELGYRLKADGCKIVLDKQLQVKHLKAWTFWRLLRSDIFDRGIPWTELIWRDTSMPPDLNLQISQRISVALVYLLVLSVTGVAIYFQGLYLVPLLFLTLLLMTNYWFHGWTLRKNHGRQVIWIGLSLVATMLMAWWHDMTAPIPPLLVAMAMLFLQHRFLINRPNSRSKTIYSRLVGVLTGGATLYILSFMPLHPLVIVPSLLLIVIIFLNSQFYVFLRGRHNIFFAVAAIPFHLLYHFYNGVSFVAGTILHWSRRKPPRVKSTKQATVSTD
jgi:glycosyltransferase involved in cell wall biosynthesis